MAAAFRSSYAKVQMKSNSDKSPLGPSEGALLRAWQGGDTGAFTELLRRYEGAMLRHARALMGEGGAHEDVVQESFMKLAARGVEIPANVAGDPEAERRVIGAWLHKVVRNGCMDVLKAESRRKTRERAAAAPEASPSPTPEVELEDTRGFVRAAIAALPSDQREVLALRLFEEKSYREIAEVTGKKVGTIGWLLSEGLQALSGRLGPALSDVNPGTGSIRTANGGA